MPTKNIENNEENLISTPHMRNNKGDIAKTVIMPGDPLRAKYIAENFLEDAYLVNDIRNMLAYTGTYKGKKVTIFSSGMGIPSACIYTYELFKFHDVEKIIRIGTCGSSHDDVKLLDVILADQSFSFSSFPKVYASDDINLISSSKELTDHIEEVSTSLGIKVKRGTILTGDIFDLYVDKKTYKDPYPQDLHPLAVEMEAFGIFYLAHKLNKQAACLLTVVDTIHDKRQISSEDREHSLNNMIKAALESVE